MKTAHMFVARRLAVRLEFGGARQQSGQGSRLSAHIGEHRMSHGQIRLIGIAHRGIIPD
jgi:hypothetical protein